LQLPTKNLNVNFYVYSQDRGSKKVIAKAPSKNYFFRLGLFAHLDSSSKFPRQEGGELGRCKMVSWRDIAIVQVVKQRVDSVLNVERQIVQGAKDMVERLIEKTRCKGMINTAFIERLNATFCQLINPLTRRTRMVLLLIIGYRELLQLPRA
jgi:hypothetical protein